MFQHVKITKQTPKTPGIAKEGFCKCRNSGGASSPRTTAIGGAWVHAPPRNPASVGRSVMASSSLHLPVGCGQHCYLQNTKKSNKQVCFSFVFRSAPLPSPYSDLLHLCKSFVPSSSISGGWWHDQGLPVCERCWVVAAAGGSSTVEEGKTCWPAVVWRLRKERPAG